MINKFDMQQDIERVLVSEEDIHARIREVGAQISERSMKPPKAVICASSFEMAASKSVVWAERSAE